jgi:hypothetical protein
LIGFWKLCLQGSCLKIMVNNLFVCLYFLWLCASDSIFCFNFYINFYFCSKSIFSYVIYANDDRKKKYLFNRNFSYTFEKKVYGKDSILSVRLVLIFIGFWKMCLQGSCSKIMVNNLFVCLYFMCGFVLHIPFFLPFSSNF